ncbi:MAG TPA: hypothetical protein VMY99_00395 [Nevskiaceae bacterium]|nr:hypothetical protein [Nevskiaceae bacterium]
MGFEGIGETLGLNPVARFAALGGAAVTSEISAAVALWRGNRLTAAALGLAGVAAAAGAVREVVHHQDAFMDYIAPPAQQVLSQVGTETA